MIRWFYLFSYFVLMITIGTIYTYSIFKKHIEAIFKVNAFESGIPFQLLLLFFSFSMILSGYLIEKIKVKKTFIVGAVLLVLSWIVSSFSKTFFFYVFSFGVLGGIGVGVLYNIAIYLSQRWIYDRKGLAIGITVSGFGLSSFLNSYVFKFLLMRYDIMKSFFYFGLFLIFIFILIYFTIKEPDENINTSDSDTNNNDLDSIEMIKRKEFKLLYFLFTTGCFSGLSTIGITVPYAVENLNIDNIKAITFVSFFSIFNTIGRPVFGVICDKFGFSVSVLISYVSIIIFSFLLYLFPSNYFIYIISFGILWFNLGAWLSIAPVATVNFFGKKHYPKNYGIVYTAYGLGAILGVNISGYIKVVLNNYYNFFILNAILAFFALTIFLMMTKKRGINEYRRA